MLTKICTECHQEKPIDQFHKSKLGKYGRYSKCNKCKIAINAKAEKERSKKRHCSICNGPVSRGKTICHNCSRITRIKDPEKRQRFIEYLKAPPICQCGCGKPMPFTKDGIIKTKFIRGHWKQFLLQNKKIRRSTTIVYLTCQYCGQLFILPKYRAKNRKFCSSDCAAKNRINGKYQVNCSFCGTELFIHLSKLKLNDHFFCDTTCRANFIIGQNNPAYTSGNGRKIEYGNNWKRQRTKALKRDNYTCQYCGKQPKKKRYLQVHHIIPAHTFDGDYRSANKLTNLLTLCLKCHKDAEFGKIVIQPKLL